MSMQKPDPRRDDRTRRRRADRPSGFRDAPRAVAWALVYAGLITASIILWWALGRLAFS